MAPCLSSGGTVRLDLTRCWTWTCSPCSSAGQRCLDSSFIQWQHLLEVDELIYRELYVEFYSTISHVIPTSKRNRPYVEFMLGG
ncbi:unnamed protein product [Linum trigynum]|uniref:Uncharacterized protein n=1 Tax=Linum trigynum TaxID=586398 RepID=A0AAV2CZS0_9ROSI